MKVHYIPENFNPKLGECSNRYCYCVTHYDEYGKHDETYWIEDRTNYLKFIEENNIPLPKSGTSAYIKQGWLVDKV